MHFSSDRQLVLVALIVAAIAAPVWGGSTNLGSLGDPTRLQSSLGDAINGVVCPMLNAGGADRNGPTDADDLFARCGDLVGTANELKEYSDAIAEAEREACAQVVEEAGDPDGDINFHIAERVALRIRNRLAQ